MKQTLFYITGVLFFVITVISGCTKDELAPTPETKIVSPGKQITSFKIVTPATTGVIDTVNKTISLTVPSGTALTSLTTEISIAPGHTISPASGVAQSFTNPVVYAVTRPDHAITNWTVTVTTPGVTIDTDITSSVTWTSDKSYLINGDIEIGNSSILTIQPGTVIRFAAGASLSIGYSSNATLIANGTAAKSDHLYIKCCCSCSRRMGGFVLLRVYIE